MGSTNHFAELLRLLRQTGGISQSELAQRAHFSQGYISQLETGHRQPPTTLHVECLAYGLDLDAATTRKLFEASGFLPPQPPITPAREESASHFALLNQLISELLTIPSDRQELLIKDLRARLYDWDLYQEALEVRSHDPYLARHLCERIFGNEQASLLLRRASYLYSSLKDLSKDEVPYPPKSHTE